MNSVQVWHRYGPVVREVVSQRSGKTYQVRQKGDSLSCNCKGWAFRKTCEHVSAAQQDLVANKAAERGDTLAQLDAQSGLPPWGVHKGNTPIGVSVRATTKNPATVTALATLASAAVREALGRSLSASDVAKLAGALSSRLASAGAVAAPAPSTSEPAGHGVRRIVLDD